MPEIGPEIGPEITGPEITGPESTGPESTGPGSTGPGSTGPEVAGAAVTTAGIYRPRRVGARQFLAFPRVVEQSSLRGRAILPLLLLPPALASILAPLGLLAASAAPTLEAAAENPLAALQASAGIALWTALFVVPVKRLLRRWRCARSVRIEGDVVTVREQALLGYRIRQMPLQEFTGVAHIVRSSLSGVRQELYLVHRKGNKSVLIHCAESIAPAAVASVGAMLGLPVVSALRLYPRLAPAPTLDGPLAA